MELPIKAGVKSRLIDNSKAIAAIEATKRKAADSGDHEHKDHKHGDI